MNLIGLCKEAMMARFCGALALLATSFVVSLSGCADEPPPPIPPTVVDLSVSATIDANPSREGRPSPIVVRLYQLRTPGEFNTADYFQLNDSPDSTLGAALIDHERLVLNPGQSFSLSRELPDDARFLGALGSYRDIDNSQWRALIEIPAHETSMIGLEIGAHQLSMSARPPTAPTPEE
jgi:type VI secretion system protein VasD